MSTVNKVSINGEMLIDLSTDTVESSDDIVKGKVGHLRTGEVVTGTFEGGGGGDSDELVAGILESRNTGSVDLDLSHIPMTSLRRYAFYYNDALHTLKLPTSIGVIGEYAFRYCSNLISINFEELTSLTNIGQYILQNARPNYVTLPANVTTISSYAFTGTQLLSLDMSACTKLTSIPSYMASSNSYITTITLPDTVITLGANAFYSCAKLTTVHLPSALQGISNNCFQNCSALGSITFPETLTTIGTSAFNSSGLVSVTFPQSVTSLGSTSFAGCSKLTEVHFKGTPTTIATNTFNSSKNLLDIYVPWSSGQVAGAPWGATNAQIYYNYVEED